MTVPAGASAPGPYGLAAPAYWGAGWRGVLPLPVREKDPPPRGWTGGDAPWPSWPDVQAWIDERPGGNIALRVPQDVIGIDVDCYDGKQGAATLAAAIARWGDLPPTWTTGSRTDGSGIRLFRIPVGLLWPTILGGGVEIVQYRHRYAVVWPSVHPDTGRTYEWTTPSGQFLPGDHDNEVPRTDELPDLPPAWVQGLTGGQLFAERDRAALDGAGLGAWLHAAGGGPECRVMRAAAGRHISDLAARVAARHDLATAATAHLMLLAAEGHTGAQAALARYWQAWLPAVAADRGQSAAIGEWQRMLGGAISIAAAKPVAPRAWGDPCANPLHGGAPPGPAPSPATAPFSGPAAAPITGPAHPAALAATGPGAAQQFAGAGTFTDRIDVAAELPVADMSLVPHIPTPEEVEEAQRQAFAAAVQAEITRLRIRDEARRQVRLERVAEAPDIIGLDDLLAQPDPEVNYRIEGLWPRHGRVLLAAAFKAGKSTLVQNTLRCLVDGGELMGTWETHVPERKVTLVDNELDSDELRLWLRDQQIGNIGRANVMSLRGKVGTFDITDDHVRALWAKRFAAAETDVLILDCLRPILDAIGLDEQHDAGLFLTAFDALLDEAGIGEAIIVHHAGHEGERSRGDSRLLDWPDVGWRLVRERTPEGVIDPSKPRFFAAYGRRVDVPEGELTYSPLQRRLFYRGGSRQDGKSRQALATIMQLLDAAKKDGTAPLSKAAIEAQAAIAGSPRASVRMALEDGVRKRLIKVTRGPRESLMHELMPIDEASWGGQK